MLATLEFEFRNDGSIVISPSYNWGQYPPEDEDPDEWTMYPYEHTAGIDDGFKPYYWCRSGDRVEFDSPAEAYYYMCHMAVDELMREYLAFAQRKSAEQVMERLASGKQVNVEVKYVGGEREL